MFKTCIFYFGDGVNASGFIAKKSIKTGMMVFVSYLAFARKSELSFRHKIKMLQFQ